MTKQTQSIQFAIIA